MSKSFTGTPTGYVTSERAEALLGELETAARCLKNRKEDWQRSRPNPWQIHSTAKYKAKALRENLEMRISRIVDANADRQNHLWWRLELPTPFDTSTLEKSLVEATLDDLISTHNMELANQPLEERDRLISYFTDKERDFVRYFVAFECKRTSSEVSTLHQSELFKKLKAKVIETTLTRMRALTEAEVAELFAEAPEPGEEEEREFNFQMSPEALDTFEGVLKLCIYWFAKLHNIPPTLAKYIEARDLVLEDYLMALAAAPEGLRPTALQALRALLRGDLLDVLCEKTALVRYTDTCRADQNFHLIGREQLRAALMSVVDQRYDPTRGRTQWIPTVRKVQPTGAVNLPIPEGVTTKTLFNGGEIRLGSFNKKACENALMHGTSVQLNDVVMEGTKLLGCHGNVSRATLQEVHMIQFQGDVVDCRLSRARVKAMRGNLKGSELLQTNLSAEAGFQMDTCSMVGGDLVYSDEAQLTNVVFERVQISRENREGLDTHAAYTVFKFCDFTRCRLEANELLAIAVRSKHCCFSKKQLDNLFRADIRLADIEAVDGTARLSNLHAMVAERDGTLFAKDKWNGLLKFPTQGHMQTDMLDPQRAKLPGVPPSPVLSGEGHFRSTVDARLFAAPLGRECLSELLKRVAVHRALCVFVEKNKQSARIALTDWMHFLQGAEVPFPDMLRHLGLPADLLHFQAADLDQIPFGTGPVKKGEETDLYVRTGAEGSDTYEYAISDNANPKRIKFIHRDNNKKYTLSTWSALRRWRLQLVSLFEKLRTFGVYMNGLVEQGYVWPELGEEDGHPFELRELVHPDVLAKCGKEAVRNNVVLPSRAGSVLSLSSASNNDGKSTLQAAIALSAVQAQAGLPVPASRAILSKNSAFDHLMVMPNTRADAGQGEGVLKERALRYKDLYNRVQDLSTSADPSNPTRLLVLMDEGSMGATNARDAALFDTRTVTSLVRTPGVDVTVIAVVQDAETVAKGWVAELGSDRVTYLAHREQDPAHVFVETDRPETSRPHNVLEGLGLEFLVDRNTF